MRLQLIQVPVSDIDEAKAFYVEQVGSNTDHDHQVSDELRFVQLTPRGRPARSIALTSGAHEMRPVDQGPADGGRLLAPATLGNRHARLPPSVVSCLSGAFAITAGEDKIRIWDPGDGLS
jgi:catechol 2,3-dioxygenase-like lactoylglutathione lyase family enzyme